MRISRNATTGVYPKMIVDPVAVFLVLAITVYVAIRLEENFAAFRSLGAALVGLLTAMVLSNVGVLPGTSRTYAFLSSTGINLGIALILLRVDVRSVMRAGPTMLAAFLIGAVGTAIGALGAGLTLAGVVGPETWKLTGQFTGTYTGGGVNFAALGRALGTSSDMFSAAVAADVAVTAIWLVACLSAPLLLERARGGNEAADANESAKADQTADTIAGADSKDPPIDATPPTATPLGAPDTLEKALHNSGKPVPIGDAAALAAIAVGAVWGAGQLGRLLPAIPEVLWLTTIVLLFAQLPAVRAMVGSALWGNYLLLLFLAANGAQSVIANIFVVGPAVFYFAAATVAVHGLVIFGVGRLVGIDAATLAVASQSNVGGPASAAALAGARGYGDRLLPGVAVGLLGYAIGNYLGFAMATFVRGILGA